ncbi:MAG: sterol desaturase family protein [Isosphaeraceae bacterium]
MNAVLDAFGRMSALEAFGWMLVENTLLFLAALISGEILIRAFRTRPVGPPPPPVEAREVYLAVSCVFLNTVVTVAGWWLWTTGHIVVRRDTGFRAWLDVVVLLMVMDLGMYLTHRLAHHPWIYPVVHATHHAYDRPRPLDLFVLNPLEVLGFGGLWLVVIWAYSSSWLGMVVYLTLNLVFGMVGHLGVEPFPRSWARLGVLRHVGTSTFHAGHHQDVRGNFGFYTLIWDRLFGTLSPEYTDRFGHEGGSG